MESFDFVVVGGGIAGVSVAAALAERSHVCVLEQEAQPGYHATGRSAAVFARNYGSESVRALTRASEAFLKQPNDTFARAPLFKPRGVLEIAGEAGLAALERSADLFGPDPTLLRLDQRAVLAAAPILRPRVAVAGLLDTGAGDIDVHELLSSWLRALQNRGGSIRTATELKALQRDPQGWRVETSGGEIKAAVIINAAGAWADAVARMAGVAPIRLAPRRRTGVMIEAPAGAEAWPMVVDVDEQFYFKPVSGRLMICPGDAADSLPCDAAPEEIDVAIAIDRIETATTLAVRRVTSRWAGLRTFTADESPVIGCDPDEPRFFWVAGLGGFGIQTSPAIAMAASALALGAPLPDLLQDAGVTASALSRSRLSNAAHQTGERNLADSH